MSATVTTTESWYTIAVPSTGISCRGSRRRRSTPTCTAPMNWVQFSCSAKRPAMRGMAGEEQDEHEDDERDAGDQQRDPRAVDVDERRPQRRTR